MLSITRENEKRFAIEFSGEVDSEDLERELDKFIAESEGLTGGQLIYRIGDFAFPGFGAIMVKMQRLPKLMSLFSRFDKAAVVSDKTWLKKIAEFEGMLIPGFEIKAFASEEESEALAWLEED